MIDADNDGVISQSEMNEVVASVNNMLNTNNNIPVEETVSSIFDKIDTKKAGEITEEEFNNGFQRDIELCDLIAPNLTNSSGYHQYKL